MFYGWIELPLYYDCSMCDAQFFYANLPHWREVEIRQELRIWDMCDICQCRLNRKFYKKKGKPYPFLRKFYHSPVHGKEKHTPTPLPHQ